MYTIELSADELSCIKRILESIIKQTQRKPVSSHWLKIPGYSLNLRSGNVLDHSSNRFIGQIGERSGSDVNPLDPAIQELFRALLERTQ